MRTIKIVGNGAGNKVLYAEPRGIKASLPGLRMNLSWFWDNKYLTRSEGWFLYETGNLISDDIETDTFYVYPEDLPRFQEMFS